MSAQVIKLIATKQKVAAHDNTRCWVSDNQSFELGNGFYFYPKFYLSGGDVCLTLVIHNGNYSELIRPKPGKWISSVVFDTGISFMPMAIGFDKSTGKPAVFIELVSITDKVSFNNKVKP